MITKITKEQIKEGKIYHSNGNITVIKNGRKVSEIEERANGLLNGNFANSTDIGTVSLS